MDKTTLLSAMRDTHAAFAAAVAALDGKALAGDAPGMDGWTRKDVIAHVEWWNRHSVEVILGSRSSVDPYPGGEEPWDADAWNARIVAEHRHRSAADVIRGEADSFADLVAAVETATGQELFTPDPHPWLDGTVAETVIEDSSNHYPEHVPHLA
ncbi:MAG: ClbS/DfsB family four-helix bundle protein [Chloroflexota bacterium]